jgi:ferrous iron transport protein B
MTIPKILILGPHFSGKTTFFHTFVQQRSIKRHYYPGTNVMVRTGLVTIDKKEYEVIDSPGIHNLVPTSENEIVTLNLILDYTPDKIIFVTREDMIDLNIVIMMQLAELGIPYVVVLYRPNDFVLAPIEYNEQRLCSFFNVPVVFATPVLQQGVGEVKRKLAGTIIPRWVGEYPKKIEQLCREYDVQFRSVVPGSISSRFVALMILLGTQYILDWFRRHVPEKEWQSISTFVAKNNNVSYSFAIANRWKELSETLKVEAGYSEREVQPRQLRWLDKYSLAFFWNWVMMLTVIVCWFFVMHVAGTGFLVNVLYNQVFWKYIEPFVSYVFTQFFQAGLITNLFVGQYGLLTIGISYAFAVILPSLFVFFLIYAFLDEMGYITRMALTMNSLLRLLGINGAFAPHLLFGNSCKIAALLKSRTIDTEKGQRLAVPLLLVTIPCISQYAIISNLLSIISFPYLIIYIAVMSLQALIALRVLTHLFRGHINLVALPITPLRLPLWSSVWHKTWLYVSWYCREITPLILLSSICLFFFDAFGLIGVVRGATGPFLQQVLNLPDRFIDTVFLGLFRKDFGAVALYDMANNGMLNSIQVLVALLFLSLSIPCLGFIIALAKEKGWRVAAGVLAFSTVYAFAIAALMNVILRI